MGSPNKELLNGRYEFCGDFDEGGTGTVYTCMDRNLQRRVAVKFLQPYREKRRIFDEVAALQRICSKNVVEIYDVVIVPPDNRIGIVQEYLPGKSLADLAPVQGNPLDFLRLLFQVANGICDIHLQGQIHRDLKPNNAKLDSEGIVKLFDFDLSRRDGPKAQTTGFHGTHGFAAPELYSYGPISLEKPIDIYAFGATAIYMVTGALPDVLRSTPPDPHQWISGGGFDTKSISLPSPVVELLDKCISPEPSQRPSAVAVRDGLAAYLLRDRHRATIIFNGARYECSAKSRRIQLRVPNRGTTIISYDGLGFSATVVDGYLSINNHPVEGTTRIQGSCVLAFGSPALHARERVFSTLDISHPEVVL